ncbi:MAG: hypothetical protein IJ157_04940 [Clostridia bacterium]|nr:hypothetical protein [Clostridia bacterium]
MFKDKKNVLRLMGFIAAVAVAIYAFTSGILSVGHKEPGYYDVGLTAEGSAMLYGSGVHLLAYAEGGSSQVRMTLNETQKAFTAALLHAWQLLDARQTYAGINNLAVLNQADGAPVRIGETLYGILNDALERTQRGEGYTLFSGMLHQEWTTLRYLDEPDQYDPLLNSQEAALMADMARLTADPGSFRLTLTAPDTASFSVSAECRDFMEQQAIDAPLLDLNLLRDAYLLELTADGLREQGYAAGYLYSESGYSLWLESAGDMRYDLYGLAESGVKAIGTLTVPAPAAYCQFTAFPLDGERYGYYTVEANGRQYRRHAYINPADGDYAGVLMTAGLGSGSASLADLGYAMAVINTLPGQEAVEAYLGGLPEDIAAFYTLQDNETTVYTNAAAQLKLYKDSGYSIH